MTTWKAGFAGCRRFQQAGEFPRHFFKNGRVGEVLQFGNDVTDLPEVAIALYVENGGAIVFESVSGDAARIVTVSDGAILPVGARRVHATGTTATGIHALVIS